MATRLFSVSDMACNMLSQDFLALLPYVSRKSCRDSWGSGGMGGWDLLGIRRVIVSLVEMQRARKSMHPRKHGHERGQRMRKRPESADSRASDVPIKPPQQRSQTVADIGIHARASASAQGGRPRKMLTQCIHSERPMLQQLLLP